jgi:hypothetical protein
MKSYIHLSCACIFFIVVLSVTSCSDKQSSQLEQKLQQPSTSQLDEIEKVVPKDLVPQINKPAGKLAEHFSVDAGATQFADSNLLVRLNGKVKNRSDVPMKLVRWTQIEGPEVKILNSHEPETAIVTPDVTAPTTLIFRLYGINAQDYANSDVTTVIVQPLENNARVVSVTTSENVENPKMTFRVALSRPATEAIVMKQFLQRQLRVKILSTVKVYCLFSQALKRRLSRCRCCAIINQKITSILSCVWEVSYLMVLFKER